jgi:hypothetical protein
MATSHHSCKSRGLREEVFARAATDVAGSSASPRAEQSARAIPDVARRPPEPPHHPTSPRSLRLCAGAQPRCPQSRLMADTQRRARCNLRQKVTAVLGTGHICATAGSGVKVVKVVIFYLHPRARDNAYFNCQVKAIRNMLDEDRKSRLSLLSQLGGEKYLLENQWAAATRSLARPGHQANCPILPFSLRQVSNDALRICCDWREERPGAG